MIFIPTGYGFETVEFGGCKLTHFLCIKKNLIMQKNWINLQFPNSNCFNTITSGNERKSLLEMKFPYSYLDFKRPPFPNCLSYNIEILRQNGMHTAGCTQTAGYSCYSWIPSIYKMVAAHASSSIHLEMVTASRWGYASQSLWSGRDSIDAFTVCESPVAYE
jgi:hypothetical protein